MMQLTSSHRSRFTGSVIVPALVLAFVTGGLQAQPDPNNYDLKLSTDAASYTPGATVTLTAGCIARVTDADGIQGWSLGVRHDPALLTLDSIDYDSTDAAAIEDGFARNTIIEEDGVPAGFTQGVVLSFGGNVLVPVTETTFSFLKASYTVNPAACDGAAGDISTAIAYDETLAVPGSPPVEVILTVAGQSVVPTVVETADITIECAVQELTLGIEFNEGNDQLVADESTTLDVNVLGTAAGGSADIQGWQYGITLDTAAIVATAGEPGDDAAALNEGAGPDFANYDLAATNAAGTLNGVTVGVAIALDDGSADEVLPIGDGETKHLDKITIRSAKTLGDGESETTTLAFSGELGDIDERDPIDVIYVIAGEGEEPTIGADKEITLIGSGVFVPRFIRGDSNNDARVDIADGIWTLMALFQGGQQTACAPAADANSDGQVDMSDSMFTFQWRLQPGATPGNLFPSPAAPYPDCGTADDANADNCPDGSTTCMQ